MTLLTLPIETLSQQLILTFMHFLWQGCAVGILLMMLIPLTRRLTANGRYLVHVGALLLMLMSFFFTLLTVKVSRPMPEQSLVLSRGRLFTEATQAQQMPTNVVVKSDAHEESTEQYSTSVAAVAAQTPPQLVSDSVARPPIATSSASLSWELLLAVAYFVGVLCMTLRLARGILGSHQLSQSATVAANDQVLSMVSQQAKAVGLRIAPVVRLSQQISIPIVVGILRPMILLPATLATGLTSNQLSALMMHELAHIRRWDPVVNFLQRLIETVLFFHPVVWLVSRKASAERENATDDMVLSTGWSVVEYVEALVRTAELSAKARGIRTQQSTAVLAAFGSGPSELKRRVLRLLGEERQSLPKLRFRETLCLFVFLPLLVLLLANPIIATEDSEPKTFAAAPPAEAAATKTRTPVAAEGAAAETSSLLVDVQDAAGERVVDGYVRLYRKIAAGELRKEDWLDKDTQTTWRFVKSVRFRNGWSPIVIKLVPDVYRLAVRSGLKPDFRGLGYSNSIPLKPDVTNHKVSVTVQLIQGGSVQLTLKDSQSNSLLEHVDVTLERTDVAFGPRPVRFRVSSAANVRHGSSLPPGKYSVIYEGEATLPGQRDYPRTKHQSEITVRAGEASLWTIDLNGKKPGAVRFSRRFPFVVKGKVIGPDGQGVADAMVLLSHGIYGGYGKVQYQNRPPSQKGAHRSGIKWNAVPPVSQGSLAYTDAAGNYSIRFAPMPLQMMLASTSNTFGGDSIRGGGISKRRIASSQPAAVTISVVKPSLVLQDLSQAGIWHASLREITPEYAEAVGIDRKKVFRAGVDRTQNFQMIRPAQVTAMLFDAKGLPVTGDFRLDRDSDTSVFRTLNSLDSRKPHGKNGYHFEHVIPNEPYSFVLQTPAGPLKSPSVKFADGNRYIVALKEQIDPATETPKFTITSVRSGQEELRDQVVSVAEPSVPPSLLQQAGMKILRDTLHANRFWLGTVSGNVRNYRYQFGYADGDVRNVDVRDPLHRSVNDRRGVILSLAMDRIARDVSSVSIQSVTSRDGKTAIELKFPASARVAAGLGVQTESQGSYCRADTTGGTLIINDADLSIAEFRGDEVVERYSDYEPIADSGISPKQVQVEFRNARHRGKSFKFIFKVHAPGLWLFDRGQCERQDNILTAQIRNVLINSESDVE